MGSTSSSGAGAIDAAWEKHSGPVVFATADAQGTPNAVYVTCVRKQGPGRFVIADNFFSKTRANIAGGCRGALLFITEEGKSFQVKGRLSVHKEGEVFAAMKSWVDPKLPGVAAVVLEVEEGYSGAERLI